MEPTELISQFLPILVLIGLGTIGGRTGFFSEGMIEGFRRLVVTFSLPVLLFSAFSRVQADGRLALFAGTIYGTCALLGFIGYGIARIFSLPRPATVFLFQGFEAGMLGYALFTSLYGKTALPAFASADLGQVLYVFTALMVQLQSRKSENPFTISNIVKAMFKSPVILAIVLGILSSIVAPDAKGVPWGEGGWLKPLLDTVGSLTTPLVCFIVGFGLKDFSLEHMGKSLAVVISRLCVTLLLALLIVQTIVPGLNFTPFHTAGILTLFILPPPFIIPLYRTSKEDAAFISSVLSLHTLISLGFAFLIAMVIQLPL